MPGHTCHLPGCPIPTPPKHLFCRAHWRMVPRDLQTEVYAANRERTGSATGYGFVGTEEAWDRYNRAVDAAKAAVFDKLAERAAKR